MKERVEDSVKKRGKEDFKKRSSSGKERMHKKRKRTEEAKLKLELDTL